MRDTTKIYLSFRIIGVFLCTICVMCLTSAADENMESRSVAEGATGEYEETIFQRGRQLLLERRLAEAARELRRVPTSHKRFPQALLGILYCAQYCPDSDLPELAAYTSKLPRSYHPAKIAVYHEQLRPISVMLDSMQRCREGNFAESQELMRMLENDTSLSTDMRQRVRLEIAELFYTQDAMSPPLSDSSPETEEDPQGLAEETLLQFITANPESNLLEAAFLRLKRHHALENSTYVLSKLQEWSQDTTHPRRAGLAFLSLLYCSQLRGEDTAALANRAATSLPAEPSTRTILREHIGSLQKHGLTKAAEPYLSLLESLRKAELSDSRTLFLRAHSSQEIPQAAADLFLRCAQQSEPGELRTSAFVNALICAMRARDRDTAENLLKRQESINTKRALLLAHAQLLPPEEQDEQALKELREVMKMEPTDQQRIDVLLEQNNRRLQRHPKRTLQELLSYDAARRTKWTDEQELYYASMVEKAARLAYPENNELAHRLLCSLIANTSSLPRREILTLHAAGRLSDAGQHAAARDLLLELASMQPLGENKVTSLLYAGRECERCGTLPALKHALLLYADIQHRETQLSPLAGILRAAVLTRINRTKEALNLLSSLDVKSTTPALQARYNTVLADTLAYSDSPKRIEQAIDVCNRTLENPETPLVWRMRTHLQRGILNTRLHRENEALLDYRAVLQGMPTDAITIKSGGSSMYYDAAAGAVYRLVQQQRFVEAANLAESAAAWPGTTERPLPADAKRAKRFAQWAHAIRQVSFQPNVSLHGKRI